MITVYISSVTLKKELHAQQNHIETVLRGKGVPFQMIDVASDVAVREEMRARCGNEAALAPQIFSDDQYCGDYTSFQQAVEEERIMEYLKLSWILKEGNKGALL